MGRAQGGSSRQEGDRRLWASIVDEAWDDIDRGTRRHCHRGAADRHSGAGHRRRASAGPQRDGCLQSPAARGGHGARRRRLAGRIPSLSRSKSAEIDAAVEIARPVFEDAMFVLSHLAWPVALSDSYYDGTMAEDALWSPNEPLPRAESSAWTLSVTSYYYPRAFLARPHYRNPSTRSANPAKQTGATRGSEVRFPSSKALFVTAVLTLDTTGPG